MDFSGFLEMLTIMRSAMAELVERAVAAQGPWSLCAVVTTVLVLLLVHPALSILRRFVLAPQRVKRILERQGVQGPPGRWMVGNAAEVRQMRNEAESQDMQVGDYRILPRLFPHHVSWSKQYGKSYMWFYGPKTLLTVTDPQLLKELLLNKNGIATKDVDHMKILSVLLGKGLLTTVGEEWALHRRIVSPAFHHDRVKDMVGAMVESTSKMLESLERAVLAETGGVEVEVQKLMVDVTADIISRTAFGGSYERGKQVFAQLRNLKKLLAGYHALLSSPVLRSLPTRTNLKIWRQDRELKRTLQEIIRVRAEQIKKGKSESYGNDLLGLMILAADEEASLKGGVARFGVQSMIDECKTFYVAGHATTATLLTWTAMLLGTHTDWQDRARAEVFEVCGDRSPDAGALAKLKIMSMILNESLRLFPPAPFSHREIVRDVTLGGLEFPKELIVYIPRIALHHDPDLWGDDCTKFKPERFADGVAKAAKHPLAFIPFSFGPRNCVGASFAMQEAKVVLAMLLQRFRFRLSPKYRHAPKVVYITLNPQHGMPLVIENLRT